MREASYFFEWLVRQVEREGKQRSAFSRRGLILLFQCPIADSQNASLIMTIIEGNSISTHESIRGIREASNGAFTDTSFHESGT